MNALLVNGSSVLAVGPFSISEDSISTAGMIFPKHVIPGWEIVDAEVPEGFQPAGYTWDGVGVVARPVPPVDAGDIATLNLRIDADVDAIYAAVIGNRSDEYNAANAEAAAYKAAGYTGIVPASVQSWADAKGWTATESADDILAAAARLTSLRDTIRAQRLAKKEAARVATDKVALDAVAAQWGAALAAIRTAAGL